MRSKSQGPVNERFRGGNINHQELRIRNVFQPIPDRWASVPVVLVCADSDGTSRVNGSWSAGVLAAWVCPVMIVYLEVAVRNRGHNRGMALNIWFGEFF